jgi:hypothetical protein
MAEVLTGHESRTYERFDYGRPWRLIKDSGDPSRIQSEAKTEADDQPFVPGKTEELKLVCHSGVDGKTISLNAVPDKNA